MDCAFTSAAWEFCDNADGLSRTIRIQSPRPRDRLYDAKRTNARKRPQSVRSGRCCALTSQRDMEIPYTVTARPDTGLWNAKVGIWLFLASEVMLFGGLFSAYIFLRLDAPPGMWPHGLLNVPVGTMNTAILILSSVTAVLAWAALKTRKERAYGSYVPAT